MSLVAYGASSDEDSDYGEDVVTSSNKFPNGAVVVTPATNGGLINDSISDDEGDYAPTDFNTLPTPIAKTELNKLSLQSLSLPKPKNISDTSDPDEDLEDLTPVFSKLPLPKHKLEKSTLVEEADDEFLHKKATPAEEIKPKPPASTKGPVKITIPSLKDFSDVEKDIASKAKVKPLPEGHKKSSLLSILPQAKSEQNFSKASSTSETSNDKLRNEQKDLPKPPSANLFIPDTVKNRRPAHNTEGVDGIKKAMEKPLGNKSKPKTLVDRSDSDESDNEGGDFFSLNSEDKLPEVSMNEINAMVAQRAAKMAIATTQYLNTAAENKMDIEENEKIENERLQAEKYQQQVVLDQEAMNALAGSRAKRRRKEENIQVVDISSDEVLPSREEWMRTALASSTAYQPTGVLVDEEPAAGTRRKHQITYLAHKAKANEAELQAMWSVNRQNRRATQSKYGF